jgi:hypothetical protein
MVRERVRWSSCRILFSRARARRSMALRLLIQSGDEPLDRRRLRISPRPYPGYKWGTRSPARERSP